MSDNSPQYESQDFSKFAMEYDSPRHFQTKISSVQWTSIENSSYCQEDLDKSKAYGKDRNLRFLEYRTIGYSPAHLLISHKLRSTLLVILDELKPKRPVRVKEMIGSRKKVL